MKHRHTADAWWVDLGSSAERGNKASSYSRRWSILAFRLILEKDIELLRIPFLQSMDYLPLHGKSSAI